MTTKIATVDEAYLKDGIPPPVGTVYTTMDPTARLAPPAPSTPATFAAGDWFSKQLAFIKQETIKANSKSELIAMMKELSEVNKNLVPAYQDDGDYTDLVTYMGNLYTLIVDKVKSVDSRATIVVNAGLNELLVRSKVNALRMDSPTIEGKLEHIATNLDTISKTLSIMHKQNSINLKGYSATEDGKIDPKFVEKVEKLYKRPENVNTPWESIIGNEEAKLILQKEVVFPIVQEKYSRFAPPAKGVLFYGTPGTGKTLMARGVVSLLNDVIKNNPAKSDWVLGFLAGGSSDFLGGGALGDTEKTIRAFFTVPRQYKWTEKKLKFTPFESTDDPTKQFFIEFLDELDSMAKVRGPKSTQIQDRMTNEFLVSMEGVDKGGARTFFQGATNNPWDVDSAVVRRFGVLVYVRIPAPLERLKLIIGLATPTNNESPEMKTWKEGLLEVLKQYLGEEDGTQKILRQTALYSNSDLASLVNNTLSGYIEDDSKYWWDDSTTPAKRTTEKVTDNPTKKTYKRITEVTTELRAPEKVTVEHLTRALGFIKSTTTIEALSNCDWYNITRESPFDTPSTARKAFEDNGVTVSANRVAYEYWLFGAKWLYRKNMKTFETEIKTLTTTFLTKPGMLTAGGFSGMYSKMKSWNLDIEFTKLDQFTADYNNYFYDSSGTEFKKKFEVFSDEAKSKTK